MQAYQLDLKKRTIDNILIKQCSQNTSDLCFPYCFVKKVFDMTYSKQNAYMLKFFIDNNSKPKVHITQVVIQFCTIMKHAVVKM